MLRTPAYLQKNRFGIFHFRKKIPKELHQFFLKNVITKSLGTGNRQEALRRARILSVRLEEQFEVLGGKIVTEEKYRRMDLFAKKVIRHPDGRIEIEELKTDPTKPKEEVETFKGIMDALEGTSTNAPKIAPPPFPTTPIQDVIDAFCNQKKVEGSWGPKTEQINKAVYTRFVQIFGNIPANSIGYDTARKYKEILQQLPPNLNKIAKYKGKSIQEIIAMKPTGRMEVHTINKNLNRMSSLFDWAKRHGYVNDNYFSGITLKEKKKSDEQRSVLEKEDLKLIFQNPIYTLNRYNHPYSYWVPLIGLLSGARIEEICQLHLDDIRQEKQIWIFDINDKDEKKLKTASSKRLIPIHSKLIDLGLLKYSEKLRAKGNSRLFPELKQERDGYSQSVSKWFGRFRKKVGVREDGKAFHSFRHTVGNTLKQRGIPYERVAAILGHKDESMTFGRYGKAFEVTVLQPVIEDLKFGDVLRGVGKFR